MTQVSALVGIESFDLRKEITKHEEKIPHTGDTESLKVCG